MSFTPLYRSQIFLISRGSVPLPSTLQDSVLDRKTQGTYRFTGNTGLISLVPLLIVFYSTLDCSAAVFVLYFPYFRMTDEVSKFSVTGENTH